MSTKSFSRVFWIVLDGMGYEHARRCIEGRLTAFGRLDSEGYLGPAEPSRPGCQTPSALYTLFSGAEPAESGIWGYRMPAADRLEESMSGFHAPVGSVPAIWHRMASAGQRFSLMNVAFRSDPVWSGNVPGLDFGYDGYRLWKKPKAVVIRKAEQRISFGGIRLHVARSRGGVSVRKGARLRLSLRVGEGRILEITRGALAYAHLLDGELLILTPVSTALVRGGAGSGAPPRFLEASSFRFSNGSEAIPVENEVVPSRAAMQDKVELMVAAIRETPSRLVIGYFPIIDEFNHEYMHLLEKSWPEGRVSRLFLACARLVDDCLGRVMQEARPGDVVVVSSDHGAVPYRCTMHFNELLAAQGLVRRSGAGYDLRRSRAYYHPSDCGLVIVQPDADRVAVLEAVRSAIGNARESHHVHIGVETDGMVGPRLAFLYPLGDANLTGNPPRRGEPLVDGRDRGGHHLSPLTPTPWIQAMLGVWSPGCSKADFEPQAPRANRDVSRYLQSLLNGGAPLRGKGGA